ncbi:hypothetical protein VRY85_11490 [Achromobacter sp. F4_2707]|uniref:hypothetical protein n=1 Tax=Achromobacter sp. F4_2707 TaxID=3114286 RepID=UPI0039C62C92
MTATFLMLILTLSDGGLSAAFVNTQTQEECERRALLVRTILQSGSAPIERLECLPSHSHFEPFKHGVTEHQPVHRYVVRVESGRVSVERLAVGEPCRDEGGSIYCVTSRQKLLAPES